MSSSSLREDGCGSAMSHGGATTAVSPPTAPRRPRRNRLAALAILQNALLGGVIYGWTSIDRTLLVASLEDGGAGLMPQQTTRIFSVASSASMLSALLLGALLDAGGPRACSVASHALVAAGFVLFATAASSSSGDNNSSFERCAVAAVLMAFGGPGIQVSVVHVSNLFLHNNRYLVLSAVTGSMSLSFSVFTAFDWLWQKYRRQGMSIRTLFGFYSGVVLASMMASWLVWPDESLPSSDGNSNDDGLLSSTAEEQYAEAVTGDHHHVLEPGYLMRDDRRVADNEVPRRRDDAAPLVRTAKQQEDVDEVDYCTLEHDQVVLKDETFRRQVISAPYLVSVLFLVVTCFLANFYIASFSTEVADAYDFSALEQHVLARRLSTIMSFGIVASFAAGFVMDQREVGPTGSLVITLALGQLHLLVLVFKGGSSSWLTLSFVLYGFFRQFLFPTFIANLADKLGFRYFGSLNGLAFAASGVSQLGMSSLVSLVQGTCHLTSAAVATASGEPTAPCSRGCWTALHVAEMLAMGALLLVPCREREDSSRRARKRRSDKSSLLLSLHPLPGSPPSIDKPAELTSSSGLYGSVSTREGDERGNGP